MRLIIALIAGCSLAGCATTSFAPPGVNLKHDDTGRRASQDCVAGTGGRIDRSVPGAIMLIDNFVDAYRCAAHSAGNGRQWFEVPSFLALTGAAAAVAFGAGADVAIAAGAANSVLQGGKAYYVPQQKAEILDHALDALLCIKTEAVGVDAYSIADAGTDQRSARQSRSAGQGGSVTIAVDEQYFDLVSAALLSVERVMSQRLSKLGAFDPAGVAAQIKTLADEQREAGAERAEARGRSFAGGPSYETLELRVLRPKLQECVVRAKL